MDAQALMQLLPVAAAAHSVHHDVFCRHEWQFAHNALAHHLRIYDKPVADVEHKL